MDSLSAERLLVRDTPPPPGTADDDDGDVEEKVERSSTPRSYEASDSVRRYETERNRSPLSRKDERRGRSRHRYERSRDRYRHSRDRRSSRHDYSDRRKYDAYYRRHRERSRSSSRSGRSSGRRRSSHSHSRHSRSHRSRSHRSRSHRSRSRSSSYTSRRSYNEGECSRSPARRFRRSERRRSRSRSHSNSRTYRRRSKSLERSHVSSSRSNVTSSDDDDTSSESAKHLSGYSNSKPQSSLKAVMEREVIKNFIHAKVQQFTGKTRPGDVFQNMPPAAEVPFKNDGSFLEMFKKMQEEKQKQECLTESETTSLLNNSSISDIKRTSAVPTIGKRRGGRVLKTGVVEKKLTSVEEESPKDAWSIYMKEVRRYKEVCCDDDSKTRPLVK